MIFKGSKLKYFSKDGATFKSRQLLKIPTLEMELLTSIQEQQFLRKSFTNNSLHYEIKGNYINIDDHNDLNLAKTYLKKL